MTTSRFIQFHVLTSYPASLLNRDDAGFAKRMPFGGASRIRISSQCLKRHWRTFEGEGALSSIPGVEHAVRSRLTFDELVLKPLVASGVRSESARFIVSAIIGVVLGDSAKAKAKKKSGDSPAVEERLQTNQLTVLGRPEVSYLLDVAKTIAAQLGDDADEKKTKTACKEFFGREQKKNLQALKIGAGLDAALFGRMVTSDILTREDAAVHVAHAMTVHGEQSEPDYFTAVDDLLGLEDEGELGSAHLGTTELTSGLFYSYVSVDVPQLVSNIEGVSQDSWHEADLSLSREVIARLPRLLTTVSPGAKKGSTAPFSYAHLLLAEVGNSQPRTLANAFLQPVPTNGDLVAHTYSAFNSHIADLDAMYGNTSARFGAALGNKELLSGAATEWGSVEQVASWASAKFGA